MLRKAFDKVRRNTYQSISLEQKSPDKPGIFCSWSWREDYSPASRLTPAGPASRFGTLTRTVKPAVLISSGDSNPRELHTKKARINRAFFVHGAGERIRTPDRLITNQQLYQLSYASILHKPTLSRYLASRVFYSTEKKFPAYLQKESFSSGQSERTMLLSKAISCSGASLISIQY